jgi:DNA mismatch repair protein MutS2
VLDELSGHLLAITTPEGDISPGASPDLLKLVNRENRLRRGLSRRVASIAARLSLAGVLRDSPPSIRNGRFVLPVASGKRGAVTGIIHDRSESGSTLFIEPSELVEDGNALQEANMEIQIERRRILREATSLVRKEKKTLARGLKAAVEIDAIFARARYRIRECTFFPGEGQMRLLGLRHPLIDRETVVRSDFILPDEWKVLVVSGPNAGGKSVLLKAVGLASMMSRSGLGGCVEPGSTMPFFTRVLVSIGDNQSIAEHLSTYSARLSEQKQMLDMGDRSTLAIIDEPAAGTDPSTGAALAASVLSRLASLGTRVLVSTHMGQLKKMAYDTPGFFNGSMVFNRETLTPSYSFISGVPGASFTLEVARAAGFQKSVLEKARILAGDSFKLDNLVISLAEMNELGARETEALKAQRLQEAKSAEARRVQHEEALSEMELLRERLIHEHDNRLREISSRADSLLALMSRKDGSPGESADARREIRKLVEEQRGKRHGFPSAPESHPGSETPKLSPGDWVDIQGWNQPGSIESVDGASARVRSGSYLLTRPLSSLARREPPGVCRASVPEWEPVQGSPEINLLGKTVEEAIAELDQRLDSAIVCGLFRLRIVHGKGVLMTGVTRWLRNDRRLKSLAQASPAEGGTGASIAVLKDGG